MDEQTLRTGMRDALDDEPPLGFEPDRIAEEARRAQRRRRATFGTGVATLAILAGVAAIPAVTGPHHEGVTPAAPPVTERSRQPAEDLPLPGVVPDQPEKESGGEINFPERELDQHEKSVARHTGKAVDEIAPSVSDVHVTNSRVPYAGGGKRRLIVTVGFTDEVGPTSTLVSVHSPGAVSGAPFEYCRSRPGDERTRPRCRVVPRENGSVLVSSVADPREGPEGALVRTVRHFRTNGAVVQASAYTFDPKQLDPSKLREQPALDERQLIELVTDPKITMDG